MQTIIPGQFRSSRQKIILNDSHSRLGLGLAHLWFQTTDPVHTLGDMISEITGGTDKDRIQGLLKKIKTKGCLEHFLFRTKWIAADSDVQQTLFLPFLAPYASLASEIMSAPQVKNKGIVEGGGFEQSTPVRQPVDSPPGMIRALIRPFSVRAAIACLRDLVQHVDVFNTACKAVMI
ncbi:hypothetical protein G6F37_009613 [Rhizopus arrhizus]|nr:hypothetical protein G6F38_009841 [Rhizopus arrhizus]KAG1154259.1 hypothetical protein G6F37_009613 [Rhizopus arrhizus]